MQRTVALAIAALLCPGCGKKSADSGGSSAATVTAPFLALTDLAKGTGLNAPSDAVTPVEQESAVYNNQPGKAASTSTSGANSACMTAINAIVFQATTASATAGGTVDLSSCLTSETGATASSPGLSIVFNSAKIEFYLALTCQGGDLSSLNGQTFGSITDQTGLVDKCTTSTFISNSRSIINSTMTVGGTSQTSTDTDTTFSGNTAAGACTHTLSGSTITYDNSCIDVEKNDSVTGTAAATEDFTQFTYTGVTDANNTTDIWHSGGVVNVTYDNWTGTVTYTSGSAAPAYSFTQAGGTAKTGTLSPASSSLALTGVRSLHTALKATQRAFGF